MIHSSTWSFRQLLIASLVCLACGAALVGQSVYFQTWALNAGPWLGSVGIEVKFCK